MLGLKLVKGAPGRYKTIAGLGAAVLYIVCVHREMLDDICWNLNQNSKPLTPVNAFENENVYKYRPLRLVPNGVICMKD